MRSEKLNYSANLKNFENLKNLTFCYIAESKQINKIAELVAIYLGRHHRMDHLFLQALLGVQLLLHNQRLSRVHEGVPHPDLE